MRYADLAPKLFDNGWRNVIPLTHDKGTRVKWGEIQRREMTEATLEHFCSRYGSAPRIGLVFGPVRDLVGIDIDIVDPRSNAQISDLAPPTDFVRIGRPPKRFLLYRGSVRSRKLHPIEVFGSSGQFAAFGPHPGTGRPYVWLDASPFDCGPEDLPEIDQAAVELFLGQAAKILVPPERRRRGSPITDLDVFARLAAQRREAESGVQACIDQIRSITAGRRHVTLLSVTGWLASRGLDADEIATLIDEHFPGRQRTEEFADVYRLADEMARGAIDKYGRGEDWSFDDD
jgi:hypothetical protein